MENLKFDTSPHHNDFISEGGKVWDCLKGVAEANHSVPHTLQVLNAAKKAGVRVFYALHSSIPSRRLRDLEVRCSYSESSLVAKDLRIRQRGAARSVASSNLDPVTCGP
jgi:hypothetical protein